MAYCSVGDLMALKSLKHNGFVKSDPSMVRRHRKSTGSDFEPAAQAGFCFKDSLLGETPLTIAAHQGNCSIVDYILSETKKDRAYELLHTTNSACFTPAGCAAKGNNTSCLKSLLAYCRGCFWLIIRASSCMKF